MPQYTTVPLDDGASISFRWIAGGDVDGVSACLPSEASPREVAIEILEHQVKASELLALKNLSDADLATCWEQFARWHWGFGQAFNPNVSADEAFVEAGLAWQLVERDRFKNMAKTMKPALDFVTSESSLALSTGSLNMSAQIGALVNSSGQIASLGFSAADFSDLMMGGNLMAYAIERFPGIDIGQSAAELMSPPISSLMPDLQSAMSGLVDANVGDAYASLLYFIPDWAVLQEHFVQFEEELTQLETAAQDVPYGYAFQFWEVTVIRELLSLPDGVRKEQVQEYALALASAASFRKSSSVDLESTDDSALAKRQ